MLLQLSSPAALNTNTHYSMRWIDETSSDSVTAVWRKPREDKPKNLWAKLREIVAK